MFLKVNMMKKIIRLQLIYMAFWAITIILLCPSITEIYNYRDKKISVDEMINELKSEDMIEPVYFNI